MSQCRRTALTNRLQRHHARHNARPETSRRGRAPHGRPAVGADSISTIKTLKPLLATLALALSLLVLSPAPAASAKRACWKDVVNDWFTNERIDYRYPPKCYREAIKHLPPVTESYSSARDDIKRALLYALSHPNTPKSGPTAAGPGNGGLNADDGGGNGFLSELLAKLGPKNADAVPLPLLVLAGISLLLLGTAGASFLARRVQARRVEVAPAPAKTEPQP